MIYTLAKLRTYARSIDERLANVTTYPDIWIDERIEEGMALAQDIKSVFYTKEVYDLTQNFKPIIDGGDGLSEVEIIMQKEVHSIYAIECDLNYFTVTPTANNHVILSVGDLSIQPTDFKVTIRYFFYPTNPFTEIEMSMEMYRLVKSSIASTVFSWLSDKESEQYHMAKAESMVVKSTFDLEKDLLSIPEARLWSGTWA